MLDNKRSLALSFFFSRYSHSIEEGNEGQRDSLHCPLHTVNKKESQKWDPLMSKSKALVKDQVTLTPGKSRDLLTSSISLGIPHQNTATPYPKLLCFQELSATSLPPLLEKKPGFEFTLLLPSRIILGKLFNLSEP